MPITRNHLACLLLAPALTLHGQTSWARVDPDDQKLIDEAGCVDIEREYKKYYAAEKSLEEEIRKAGNSTVATNVVGVATMAVLGVGFFTWNDSSNAQENLAELRAYREAIGAAGVKKSCAHQAPGAGPK